MAVDITLRFESSNDADLFLLELDNGTLGHAIKLEVVGESQDHRQEEDPT